MRQEMEIVKKSLQEAKDTINSAPPVIDLEAEPMKAVDLLAIVQASVQPLTTNRQVINASTVMSSDAAPSVVDTNVMPKSHGDPFPLPRTNTMNSMQQATDNVSSMAPNVGNRNVPPPNQFYNNDWNERENIGARPPMEDQWVARQNIPDQNDEHWAAGQNDDQWGARQNNSGRNDDQWTARQNIPERGDQWVARQNMPDRNNDQWNARQSMPNRGPIGRGGPWQPQPRPTSNVPNRAFTNEPWNQNINIPDNSNDSFSHNNEPNMDMGPQDDSFGRGNQWEPEQNNEPNMGPWNGRQQNKPEFNRFNQGNNFQGNNFNFKGGQGANDFAGNMPVDNVPNRNNQFKNNFRPHQRGRGGFRGGNRRGRGGRGHF